MKLVRILPHLCIIISVMMLTLIVINKINSAMGFLRGDVFITLLLIYVIVTILTSLILIVVNARNRKG